LNERQQNNNSGLTPFCLLNPFPQVYLATVVLIYPWYPGVEAEISAVAADSASVVPEPCTVFVVAVSSVQGFGEPAAVFVAVVASFFVVAELLAVFAAVVASFFEVAEPAAVFAAVVAVAFEVVGPVVVFVAGISGLQASADIAFAFVAVAPVSVVVVWVDSSVRPRFLSAPNNDWYSRFSSSVEVFG
jgi:hypothetical protein